MFLSEINLSKQKKLTIPFMKQNKHSINVCLTSDQLHKYEIENSIVVVIDILRATTVISTAFHYGIKSVKPVSTIEEAISYKQNKITFAQVKEMHYRFRN